MYGKTITQYIIECQAKGLTGEETQQALKDQKGITVHLNTIYAHRKSSVGQEITDELIRQQQRDILRQQQSNPELSLKYRNELLKILVPFKAEIESRNLNITKTEVNVNVTSDLLKQYESLFEEAALLENCAPQPLHPAQTNREASPSPPT